MATQITDSGARAVLALRSMEANAFRVSQVATRLFDEHVDLPELTGVRPLPTATEARIDLQLSSFEDARTWADALGGRLRIEDHDNLNGRMGRAEITVDGVLVVVCAFVFYTAQERAERKAAEQVAA
jgi:hypothetical protein